MSRASLKPTLLRGISTFARRLVIGRVPKLFDTAYYLQNNPDVQESGLDPYLHYVLRGASENRDPAEDFDTKFFRNQSGATRLDPVRHYVKAGVAAGLDPNPKFSTASYLNRYPDVAARGVNPLLHYRTDGRSEGRTSEASEVRATDIPALRSVLSRHLHSLPTKEGRPFTIDLLRAMPADHPFKRVPRLCVLLTITDAEITLFVDALGAMNVGGLAAISLAIDPGGGADEAAGPAARPKFETLLAAFEHCHVATVGNTVRVHYAELRLWDLRPHKPRVAEIFPDGMAEIRT